MNANKIQKNIAKVVVAVALTLTVTLTTGMWDDVMGLDVTPSASACIGSSSSSGGGGGGC